MTIRGSSSPWTFTALSSPAKMETSAALTKTCSSAIPAFNRFTASVLAGAPDISFLSRGRDTFAGYNIQMIVLSVPAALLKGSAGNVIGVSATTLRGRSTHRSEEHEPFDADDF